MKMLGYLTLTLLVLCGMLCSIKGQTTMQTTIAPHPRLYLNNSELNLIKDLIQQDPVAMGWYTSLKARADALLKNNVTAAYHAPPILDVSRLVLERVPTLAGIYRLTGNTSYADRAVVEMRAACAFPNWDPSAFLDTAEMMTALSIGYDWLYSYMSVADRNLVETSILNKGLFYSMEFYVGNWSKDPSITGAFDWSIVTMNWNQVCNGGSAIAAMALWDVYPNISSTIFNYAYSRIGLALVKYGPDGGWIEGPMYWEYATSYTSYYLGAMLSSFGTDFGLMAKYPYIGLTGDFHIYMTSNFYNYFFFGDSNTGTISNFPMILLGRLYNKPMQIAYERQISGPTSYLITTIRKAPNILHLFYSRLQDATSTYNITTLPMDAYFRDVEVVTGRSNWIFGVNTGYSFFSIKGGDTNNNHQHLDLGTFMIEKNGQIFVTDSGSDNYSLPNYFSIPKRYVYYRTGTFGHNTLSFNGDNNQKITNANISNYVSTSAKVSADIDLSFAYSENATKVTRSFVYTRAQNLVDITDKIVPNANSKTVTWKFHTSTAATVQGNKVFMVSNGKNYSAQIISPPNLSWELVKVNLTSPQIASTNLKRLEFTVAATQALSISVQFADEPLDIATTTTTTTKATTSDSSTTTTTTSDSSTSVSPTSTTSPSEGNSAVSLLVSYSTIVVAIILLLL